MKESIYDLYEEEISGYLESARRWAAVAEVYLERESDVESMGSAQLMVTVSIANSLLAAVIMLVKDSA
jgi:hypothetical protein